MDDQNNPTKQPSELDASPYNQDQVLTAADMPSPTDPLAEPDTISVSSDVESDTNADPASQATPSAPSPVAPVTPVYGATSPVEDNATSGLTAPTSPRPRKKGMIAIIIAAAVVVLGGGSALAYNFYYQNSQKVVTDGIVNMMRAKTAEFTASLTMKSESASAMNVAVEMSGAGSGIAGKVDAKISAKMGGQTYNVTAAGVFDDKGDIYFKVGDIKKVVDEFSAMMPVGSEDAINAIVAKIDNKWIKIDADDMKDVSEEASKTQTCMTDAINKFKDDKAATKQVGDLYRANQFIVIDEKLGSKDGSLGYVLSSDEAAAKAFALSLKDTDIYKDLNKCDDSFKIDEKTFDQEDSAADASNTRVELWVDRWSHQITKLSVVDNGTDSDKTVTTMVFEPVFNKSVTVETPKGATTIQQLQKDIEALSAQYTSSMYGPSYSYES